MLQCQNVAVSTVNAHKDYVRMSNTNIYYIHLHILLEQLNVRKEYFLSRTVDKFFSTSGKVGNWSDVPDVR